MARILNDLPRWLVITLWLIANIVYFVVTYFRFLERDYDYTNLMLGPALPWARASAACLNLNCMLILLPVCRNLLSAIRGSFQRCCNRNIRRLLDKHITFHRYIAYMICVHTAIHLGAHIFNVERYREAYNSRDRENRELLAMLSSYRDNPSVNTTFLNFIDTPNTDAVKEALKTLSGVSGVVITLILIVMVSSATELIRRSYFEIFWFTHHLFILFFIGVIVHGFQGIVRRQSNVAEHDPQQCMANFRTWGTEGGCPIPQFVGLEPNAWKWVVAPLVIYFIERVVRFWRSTQKVVVSKVVQHPSKVYELQMKKKGFKMGPGQYIFLHCPSISSLEWHPFTLTSAPEDDYFSVHIRRAGDWTEALAKACYVDDGEFQSSRKMPRLAVDGPFGTATEDIFWYEVDVFVAGGIGVTPFASILRHIWHKHKESKEDMKLRKVYFYWVCPDTNSFEWINDLLKNFDQQMAEDGHSEFLNYYIYLTRGWDKNQAQNIILHEHEDVDPVTGLAQKTHYGRPNWDKIFQDLAKSHPSTSVGVFFCGPGALSMTLHKMCNKHSAVGGTKFFYNKENLSTLMDHLQGFFKTKRYQKCLDILRGSSRATLLDMFTVANNINSVEISLNLLSGETTISRIQNGEEEFVQLLQKIRCIPCKEETIALEICVVCNIIVSHLVQGVCPIDHCLEMMSITLQKVWNLVGRSRKGSHQTTDRELSRKDLVFNLLKDIWDSDMSGQLRHSLVEMCSRCSTVLFMNRKSERALQFLSLCKMEPQKNQGQEDPLLPALLIPLEVPLLGGEACSPESRTIETWHLLTALCLYPEDPTECKEHLQKVTQQVWQPYTKLMEAQLEFDAGHYLEAMVLLSKTAGLPSQMTNRLMALHCNLFGMCLSKLNKPHSAVQKFREALDWDFSCLVPLYNISVEYRQLGLEEAELESLNLLVTALENKEVKKESPDSIFFQKVVKSDINLIQSVYYLAKACEVHSKYNIASEKYIHLISLINGSAVLKVNGCEIASVPSVSEIYRCTIFSLLKSKKYQQCETLCKHVLSCQPSSVLDLSSILSQHSQELSQMTSTQPQSRPGTFALRNNFSQSVLKENSLEEKEAEASQGKRKRLPTEEVTDLDPEGQTELVLVHLYKAEAQVCLNKIGEAIDSLDTVLEVIRNSCSFGTPLSAKSSSQDTKRQRLSSDGAARPTSSADTALFWEEVGQQASHVYCCLGTCLARQNKLTDALHYLRLSFQLDKGSLRSLYNCTAVLWRLERQKEGALLWCKGRQLDTQTDSFQMAALIKRKKATLQDPGGNDLPFEVKDKVTDQEAVRLDVRSLEFLIRWRRDS
ncbi:uncharacterized protein LOC134251193 [Saccostrea cucullata]|uniref:uncharacterized protein LOC134251193 n=1 Tax=Saccostrea cuccullata TaxID=36930 RepID=UPI002ED205E7